MKKRIFIFVSIILLMVCFMGILPFAYAGEPIKMVLGTSDPPDLYISDDYTMGIVFKSMVERWSRGGIVVEHHAATLGSSREMIEACQLNSIQATISGGGPITHFFKPAYVFSIPYLMPSIHVAWKVFDGPFGKELREAIRKKTGMRVISIAENGGYRHFTNNVRPIRTPDDLKGIKMRTMQVKPDMIAVRAMGGSPTPVNWKELYTALKTGVVDGQENGIGLIRSAHVYEVQKYLTLDGHKYDPEFFYINDKWFSGLKKEYKKIILDAGHMASVIGRGVTQTQAAIGLDYLRKKGMEVYVPKPEEIKLFRDKSQGPTIKELRKEIGDYWIDKILDATKKAIQEWEVEVGKIHK